MKKLLPYLIAFVVIIGLGFGQQAIGAVLNSNQVGTNPVSGYYLETNGATSTWAAVTGGSGSSTIVFAGDHIIVTASGTNGYIVTNSGVTSTSGNWAGTWQGVNSTTFYLGSNPAGYTSSTVFNVLGMNNVTTTSNGSTTVVSFTGILPAANGGTATTTALGTCAFLNTCGSGGSSGVASSTPITSGTLPQFQANGNITNSLLSQLAGVITDLGQLLINLVPPQSTSTASFMIGSTPQNLPNASGTDFTINSTSSADFIDLENNSSSVFEVASSGAMTTANITDNGVANSLITSNGSHLLSNFAGSANCSQGVYHISNSGAVTCANFFGDGTTVTSTINVSTTIFSVMTSTLPFGIGTVTTSSAVTAKNFAFWNSTNGSALNGTSSAYQASANDLTLASTSDNGLFSVVNASNTVAFQVASTTNNNYRLQVASGTTQLFGVSSSTGVTVVDAPSSTLWLGINTSTPGCFGLYDAANGTPTYAYVSSTALIITTTKPSFCSAHP
jgi:hypothetical protein